jgi:RNA recognition motif-containing protein
LSLLSRWAFVDFTSIEHATTALTNPRNHRLNGRELVVEYASPDAVRRGGGGPPRGSKNALPSKQASRNNDEMQQKWQKTTDEAESKPETIRPAGDRDSKTFKKKGDGRRSRPAPGAALALAKREQIAIVPSQGTKITFDK